MTIVYGPSFSLPLRRPWPFTRALIQANTPRSEEHYFLQCTHPRESENYIPMIFLHQRLKSDQVIRRSSALPRPPCDGTTSASVWPSPRQTPGPSCPYPSDRPPSGHLPDRRQALHANILQIGLRLAIAQADAKPVMTVSFR